MYSMFWLCVNTMICVEIKDDHKHYAAISVETYLDQYYLNEYFMTYLLFI